MSSGKKTVSGSTDKCPAPKIGAETRFGDNIISQLERDLVGDDGGLSVGDIGKRTRMNRSGSTFKGLHQVWLDGAGF